MNESEIVTQGFVISNPGDESVGIFPSHYELTGHFVFNDPEHLEMFKEKLKEAFEWCEDGVEVESFEEFKSRDIEDEGIGDDLPVFYSEIDDVTYYSLF